MAAATAVTVNEDEEHQSGSSPNLAGSSSAWRRSWADRRRQSSAMKIPDLDEDGNERHELARGLLVERLELERELYSGLRMIILCAALFSSLISTLHYQKDKDSQFALQESYEDTFNLADAGNIVAPHQLRDHLRVFSAQVRTLQVLSSEFFVETEGQLKILGGIKLFAEAQVIEVEALMPRIDSESFSFMAWVQRDSADSSGYILRKPLGKGQAKALSCYGWHIGTEPRFDFGAHDVGLGDQSINEESVSAAGTWEMDSAFHLEMIVVNKTTISFYRDSTLRSAMPLRRPVTDCSGSTLMVGGAGLRMAEITFYARSLSQTEIEEIYFSGFTFEAIAAGKVAFQPQETDFDRLLGSQDEAVSTLLASQDQALAQAAVGRVLTQALIQELQAGASVLPRVTAPPDAACDSEWPPCHVIPNVSETLTHDPVSGRDYYNLVPPSVRGGAGPQARFAVPGVSRELMLQYDAASFPSWKGQSVSFTVWVKPTVLGYLLAKSPDNVQNIMCWSLYVEETWGIGSLADAWNANQTWRYPQNVMRWGGSLETSGAAPITNGGKKLRHLSWVFDKAGNALQTYVDGTLVADQPFEEAGVVGELDCDVTAETYIGFLHRAPGGLPFSGEIQDFRMYVGAALSAAEVRRIADGEGSSASRECSYSTEGQDSMYTDMNGNTCAWYQEATADTEAVCTASSVRAECPVACGTQEPCFEAAGGTAPTYQIFEKIMRIEPRIEGLGSMCVREGVDVVAQCFAAMASRDPDSYPADGSPWTDRYLALAEGGLGEWNVTDCNLLAMMVEPSCSFKVPGDWTRSFDAEVQASDEFTLSFWVKSSKADLGVGIDLWMTFYSSVAPPIPLLRVVSYFGVMLFQWVEDVNMMVSYEAGQWVHMALTFGAPRGADNQRHIQLVKDSVYSVDLLNRAWCPPQHGEFIQAISVMHAHETLLSPIQVTARAKSVKETQLHYYQLRPAFRWRRGPELPEATRHSQSVRYQRAQFDSAGALLAPPILLQRRQSSAECAVEAGSDFQDRVWRAAVGGVTCGRPYQCSSELLDGSAGLMACRGSDTPASFFGRAPLTVGGKEVFSEFLVSIADASILVRGGELFETSKFIDTQTDSMLLPVVLFAPNEGVITLITLEASFSARVNVDYNVKQFQVVEGESLRAAESQAAITFVIIVLTIAELVFEAIAQRKRQEGRELRFIVADVAVLGVMPTVYLAMRLGQLRDSSDIMAQAVGDDGLGGVPWASTSIPLDAKMDAFFAGLEELQGHIDREQRMDVLGFVAAVLLLIRMILATKAHPRTAVLVATIMAAADDLWHFCLLFLVLFLGFGALAYVSFGVRREEFHSLDETFETLFDMMLGSLPKTGGAGSAGSVPSQKWTSDPLLVIFVTLFNFLVFFVMLNFIIAIIVESYLSTKKHLEDELTEQEFFTDIFASMRALTKRVWFRWPTHGSIISKLRDATDDNVGEEALARLFAEWDRVSIRQFVAHYEEFPFLCPEKIPELLRRLEGPELVNEIETRIRRNVSEMEQRLYAALRDMLRGDKHPSGSELFPPASKPAEVASQITLPATQREPKTNGREQHAAWAEGDGPGGNGGGVTVGPHGGERSTESSADAVMALPPNILPPNILPNVPDPATSEASPRV